MSENDNDIRKALEQELSEYDAGGGGMLHDVLVTRFRGRLKWAGILTWVYILIFAAIAVFAGATFLCTGALGEKIMYATIFLAAFFTIQVVKLWYWMLANRHGLTREIKRLELQVARLADQLAQRKA